MKMSDSELLAYARATKRGYDLLIADCRRLEKLGCKIMLTKSMGRAVREVAEFLDTELEISVRPK